MFASKVARAKAKTVKTPTNKLEPQQLMRLVRPFGGGTIEQAHVLQQSIGNQATIQLMAHLAPRSVGSESRGHNKQQNPRGALAVGQTNDPLEHEADRVADQVMRMPALGVSGASTAQVSRKCAACEEKETLHNKSAGTLSSGHEAPPIVHEVLRSPGHPLDAVTRGREAAKATSGRPQPITSACCVHNFGPISVERKDGVVHGPAGAANRFDDCPAKWRTTANTAQKLGSSWVANVVNGLTSLPKPIPVRVANLLTKHFHTTLDRDIAKIAGRYKELNTAINQSMDFECETSCDPDVLGYVYSIWSDLHLCPYWFNSGAELQASTVIHELAHDVVGCDDNAYEWQTAKYNAMSVDDAIDNADSYAHFAWDASKP